ncbi:ATP-binding cassette domain-containing protein [Paracoccus sp. YIM 132242]|uniref:ATP-binding cassette domain-containing protein n=1 Tax=Paracoccus lichenicola TaxID=2665644 RepID=A0A6L6HTI7_9RHOB|nr:ABC transporter ATP-binding protein [Paracoccus lichenicola]MTE01561.1 ATP-binding cassette domain-containing protein [Paracoccus lichenicola]
MKPAVPIVALDQVTKRFPGVVANDRISLAFQAGEVHALLGENGAGKSTLISMLAGIQRPDEGAILIDGQAVALSSPGHALRLGIGTVYQHRMLVPTLTVAENLLLGTPWWQRPRRAAVAERFRRDARAFGIDVPPEARVDGLSLGEQQQVEIIRALWRGGRVLVLDEPTSMLSPQGVEELGAMMRRMAAQGVSIIFITHHLTEALAFGDRVSVLRGGRCAGGIGTAEFGALPRPALMERVVGMMFGTAVANTNALAAPSLALPRAGDATMLEVSDLSGQAFRDIRFDVRAGEIFGIAGVDGNGQTPLVQALAGQIPSRGRVMLGGQDLQGRSIRQRHGMGLRYVTDDRGGEGTVATLPVSLNLLLKDLGRAPFWKQGFAERRAIQAHASARMREFDVRAPSTETPIGKLSGGNIQKALLARELAGSPRLIIYNKPTHGLDLRNIEATRARIRETAQAGLATVLVSTDLSEVLALSHRVGVMLRGRMVGIVGNGPDARDRVGRLMAGLPESAAEDAAGEAAA